MGETLLAESANWEIVAENTFTGAALIFLVARAFSSGTTALTGIEAVANGVPGVQGAEVQERGDDAAPARASSR